MRSLVLLICCCAISGCVTHRATVDSAEAPAGTKGEVYLGDAEHPAGAAASRTVSGPLPQSLPVTAWRKRPTADGSSEMLRGDTVVRTPLPWWQRFPADLVSDFIPIDASAETQADVTFLPVAERSPTDLAAEAAAAGFSSPPRGIP